jgi:hypothetical protein
MTADDVVDPLEHSLSMLTPRARRLLHWALLAALSRPPPADLPFAADLVNLEVEIPAIDAGDPRLAGLVARAMREAERAPVVRVDHDPHCALLTSTEHLWRPADYLDEAVLVLGVLAGAYASGLGEPAALEELLESLEDLTPLGR